MLKHEIFKEGLALIASKNINAFVLYVLERLPDYFWTVPVSASGKYHGGELLVDHVLGCVAMGAEVCEQQKGWTQRQKDQLIAAVILHDGWKCGDGEKKYTEEDFKKGYCVESSIGLSMTNKDHAEICYQNMLKLVEEYNKVAEFKIGPSEYMEMAWGIRYHMGPWTPASDKIPPFDFKWSYDSVIVQVHNVDYHQTKNSMWFRGEHDKNN